MKRFLAFYGSNYYPLGGMDDFIGDFNALGDAINHIKEKHKKALKAGFSDEFCWSNVWDSKHKKIVWGRELSDVDD